MQMNDETSVTRLRILSRRYRVSPTKINFVITYAINRQRLDEAIKAHRRAANRFYVRALPSVLQISVPTGAIALGGLAGIPSAILQALGLGAVAVLTAAWWAKFRDDQAALRATPYQYLLTLEQKL
jgi:hypothetical protein